MWNPLKSLFSSNRLTDAQYEQARQDLVHKTPIPVLWLFGKTGSGKSSIIRYLTGVESIEIGTGYKPQTQFSARYDFPDESHPLVRFIDTRGLGEPGYDPQEDITAFGAEAQLMIVVVRVMDHALEELVAALRKIRRSAPRRPVILALTALHDAFPGRQHPDADPFDQSTMPLPEGIDADLHRSLERQYERFQGLFDRAVPIDLTPVEEGFHEPNFGGTRLRSTVVDSLPAAYRQTLLQLEEVVAPLHDLLHRRASRIILATSTLAATAAAIPLPWIDIPVVLALQSHLAYKLARIYRQPLDAQTLAQVSGALGGRIALQLAIRETLKFIPWVGMAANAAAAFAYTYAGGMAWSWYFAKVRAGHVPSESELRQVFREQLARAAELWKTTHSAASPPAETSSTERQAAPE